MKTMKNQTYLVSRVLFLILSMVLKKWGKISFFKSWAHALVQSQGGIGVKLQQFSVMRNHGKPTSPIQGSAVPCIEAKVSERILSLDKNLAKSVALVEPYGLQGSISQVHRAKLKTGEWVALKFSKSGMNRKIQADSKILSNGLSRFKNFREGFDSKAYSRFFERELNDELDIQRESSIQIALRKILEARSSLVIAEVIPDLSAGNVLCMKWQPSSPLSAAVDLPPEKRDDLLRDLSFAILVSLFDGGMVLSDLNPGNLGWRKVNGELELILYDFGSVLELKAHQTLGIAELILGVKTGQNVIPALSKIGFSGDMLEPIRNELLEYLRVLFEPILSEEPFDLQSWNRKERAEKILGENRWCFMNAAPPELFGLMRCLHGWFYWHQVLDRPFFCSQLILSKVQEYLDSNSPKEFSVSNRERGEMKAIKEDAIPQVKLYIQVFFQNVQKVKLALPAACAGDLNGLLDSEMRKKIESSGFKIDYLSQKAKESGFTPMDLLHETIGEKEIHIFLA